MRAETHAAAESVNDIPDIERLDERQGEHHGDGKFKPVDKLVTMNRRGKICAFSQHTGLLLRMVRESGY